MTEPMTEPVVRTDIVTELDRDLVVIPNRSVELVPNIGVIGGREAVLVVDTGLGPANAAEVLAFAAAYARGRKLYLTTTHFHPEHAFGARTFAGHATYLANRAQADDLARKGEGYLRMFGGLGEAIAHALTGTEIPAPDLVYEQEYELDLGGRVVRMQATGQGHSLGDQVITVPDAGVLFTGDLVETGQFAIFPWFPPHDTDVSGLRWIAVMERLRATRPRKVVPGHGDLGDASLLEDTYDYLTLLRDETWRRRDSAMSEETIIAEVTEVMIGRHPGWTGRDWIRTGVACLCGEG